MYMKKTKKNGVKKRRYKRHTKKYYGGQHFNDPRTNELIRTVRSVPLTKSLLDNPERSDKIIEILDANIPYDEDDENDLSFIDSLEIYQNFSKYVNGILRENVIDYYSDIEISSLLKDLCNVNVKSIRKENLRTEVSICISNDLKNKLTAIKKIDAAFESPLCQRFESKTVLFRGTDKHYDEPISKAYTSTTKTIENLFDMSESKEKFFDNRTRCCINVLIVDADVPYLDLELPAGSRMPGAYWSYQQEILLPRGLLFILVNQDTYTYKGQSYTAYIYEVKLNNQSSYKSVPIDLHIDVASQEMIDGFLKKKNKDMNTMFKYIKQTEETGDKMQDLYYFLEYLSNSGMKFYCSKEFLDKKNRQIMERFTKLNDYIVINGLIKPGLEREYDEFYSTIYIP